MQNKTVKLKKIKKDSTCSFVPTIILFNFLIQTCVFIAACILALIADLKSELFSIVGIFAFVFSGAFSGFMTGVKTNKNGLVSGVLYSLPPMLIYIILSLILNNFKIDFTFGISVILYLIAASVGGVVAVNLRISSKFKYKRRR